MLSPFLLPPHPLWPAIATVPTVLGTRGAQKPLLLTLARLYQARRMVVIRGAPPGLAGNMGRIRQKWGTHPPTAAVVLG